CRLSFRTRFIFHCITVTCRAWSPAARSCVRRCAGSLLSRKYY
ncbi:hypothetical protein, partial [Pseudomonas sp. FG-3G]